MNAWTTEQLRRIGEARELELASRRPDGTLNPYVTMWVVRTGDDIYVRSAGGPRRSWYRAALASGRGRIRAGGVEADVTFAAAEPHAQAGIDTAYHDKYDRYGPGPVGHVTRPGSHAVTIRLVPLDPAAPQEH